MAKLCVESIPCKHPPFVICNSIERTFKSEVLVEKLAVYAGTFDPLTVGHLWMIEQGAKLFNKLIIAIGTNPEKHCMFSADDRVLMLRRSVERFGNVEVDRFANQFLITYAQSIGAQFILRGIRTESDYEYERVMRNINGDLNSGITTVFLMPPRGIAEVSSSMVKGLIGPEGWETIVKKYLPKPVFEKLKDAHMQNQNEKQWLALWKRIGARGNAHAVYNDLVMRYSEPRRAYHTLEHIRHCLDEFEQVRHLAANPDIVELALWYHDAIYDTKAKDNEERGAALAIQMTEDALLPDNLGQSVANLIIATKHASDSTDPDVQIIVDVDLSILGQDEEKFDEYERRIRTEYEWVAENAFIVGRSAMLKAFSNRPAIYSTQFFRNKYEAQARQNIVRSLARLSHRS